MRLLEAIVDANQRATSPAEVQFDSSSFGGNLPIIALTCIDPRLNRLFPRALGVPEEQFIWLRNAGNIIFDPLSSMTRTLALAAAIKGGKEIAIIGHTDCKVGKTSVMDLTDRFRALGVDRSRLPDNLNEFFGLFASERQNVMRGTGFVRQSPLIGPKVPVHGLMIDVNTGRLEWVVNGYEAFATTSATARPDTAELSRHDEVLSMPDFKMGDMKFPDAKIGDVQAPTTNIAPRAPEPTATPRAQVEKQARRVEIPKSVEEAIARAEAVLEKKIPAPLLRIAKSQMYKVMGDDQKVYGPVLGREIERWFNEGRIDLNTLAQKVGYKNWKRLADFAEEMEHHASTPPAVPTRDNER
jgi:carbonic anhydrase